MSKRPFGWLITRDYTEDEAGLAANICGPGCITPEIEASLRLGVASETDGIFKFRLYDDDDTLYYEGLMYAPDGDGRCLRPSTTSGCLTQDVQGRIDIFENGKWSTV